MLSLASGGWCSSASAACAPSLLIWPAGLHGMSRREAPSRAPLLLCLACLLYIGTCWLWLTACFYDRGSRDTLTDAQSAACCFEVCPRLHGEYSLRSLKLVAGFLPSCCFLPGADYMFLLAGPRRSDIRLKSMGACGTFICPRITIQGAACQYHA